MATTPVASHIPSGLPRQDTGPYLTQCSIMMLGYESIQKINIIAIIYQHRNSLVSTHIYRQTDRQIDR
ncbi:hypothetical protein Hanom_Chr05g00402071 [Helianthus anomalus]